MRSNLSVWLLEDQGEILGGFTTRAKAEAYKKEYDNFYKTDTSTVSGAITLDRVFGRGEFVEPAVVKSLVDWEGASYRLMSTHHTEAAALARAKALQMKMSRRAEVLFMPATSTSRDVWQVVMVTV